MTKKVIKRGPVFEMKTPSQQTTLEAALRQLVDQYVQESIERRLMLEQFYSKPAETASESQLLSRDEVAKLTGLSMPSIHRLMNEGALPFIKIGRSTRFRASVVEDLITNGEIRKYKRYGK